MIPTGIGELQCMMWIVKKGDPTNKAAAFVRMSELREEGRLPLGLIYEGKHPALEAISVNPELPAPALHDLSSDHLQRIRRSLAVIH